MADFEITPVDPPLTPGVTNDYNTGWISGSINPQPVYARLGIAPQSGKGFCVAYLCSNAHGKTNRWSIHKPVRYATMQALTDAQFAGTMNDHGNGIYYGLRCAFHQGNGDGQQDTSRGWEGLHECDWSYLPPRPGIDYSRLSDWDKHNLKAIPNPDGRIGGTKTGETLIQYYDQLRNIDVDISVLTNSAGNFMTSQDSVKLGDTGPTVPTNVGVNLQEVANVTDIGTYYPCILLTFFDGQSGSFIRALAARNALMESKKYQPLRNESDAWAAAYVAEVAHDVATDIVKGGLNIYKQCKARATVFLVNNIRPVGLQGWTQWTSVGEGDKPPGDASKIYTVPNAANVIIDFRRMYAQGLKFLSASTRVTTRQDVLNGIATKAGVIVVRVLPTWVKEEPDNMPDRTFNYTFTVQLSQSLDGAQKPVGGGQYTVSGKWVYPDEQTGMEIIPILQLDIETDVFELIAPGTHSTTFQIYWYVKSDKTGDKILNSGTDSVTHTYS